MYAGEARTASVTRRTFQPVQPPPRGAVGAIIEPEDCRGSFGEAIAVRGSLIAIGAPRAGDAGKVWLHDADRLDQPPVCLMPPPGVQGEAFGMAVAISPNLDRIVVGAPMAEVDGVPQSGRLYLWKRDGNRWRFERAFTDPDPERGTRRPDPAHPGKTSLVGERLGRSVVLDGTSVIAGAPHATMELRDEVQDTKPPRRTGDALDDTDSPTVETNSRRRGLFEFEGAVLIWDLGESGDWVGPQYALLPRGRPAARFGTALARLTLSGEDLLAVSAPPQRTKMGFEGGTVSLFMRRTGTAWRSEAQVLIAPTSAEPSDFFGDSIALGDNLLAVGMWQGNLNFAVDAGKVAVFQRDVETRYWKENEAPLSSPAAQMGSGFGTSVASMGRLLLAGQPGATREGGSGRAFVFSKVEVQPESEPRKPTDPKPQPWQPIAELVPPPFVTAQGFGSRLAAGDDWVAVGAHGQGAPASVTLFRVDRTASGIVDAPAPAIPAPPPEPPVPSPEASAAASPAETPAKTAEPAPTTMDATSKPTEPIAPPVRTTPLAPPANEPLRPGTNSRPSALPTSAEPASLYEIPPETPTAPKGTSGATPAAKPETPPERPYETPPETPGTKP